VPSGAGARGFPAARPGARNPTGGVRDGPLQSPSRRDGGVVQVLQLASPQRFVGMGPGGRRSARRVLSQQACPCRRPGPRIDAGPPEVAS
jgi:hypothetical protein